MEKSSEKEPVEVSFKEKRVRALTKIYYSNPAVQKAIFGFSADREVVPSYMMRSFGRRPDTLQYPSDLMGLVNKGATSFHASEELWNNPLEISSEMGSSELSKCRKAWDLLIDIDSPFLDYSKIAARLLIDELERQGIKNYGLKFSGSKGFHIIVPSKAFPVEFEGQKTALMFPEWPRAISEYLLFKIRSKYNRIVSSSGLDFNALKTRTNLSKEDLVSLKCPNCSSDASKRVLVSFVCDRCKTTHQRPNYKVTKRKLRCTDDSCPGFFVVKSQKEYFFCDSCKTSSFDKDFSSSAGKKVVFSNNPSQGGFSDEFFEEVSAEKIASLDLVLVASRHLFRMPYSLHEKTGLASVVISKADLESFSPKDAEALKVSVKDFCPISVPGEAKRLLQSALAWKKLHLASQESVFRKGFSDSKGFSDIDLKGVPDEFFPSPIKKLLLGLQEGRKRGLFVLLTFLRCLNFPAEEIVSRVQEWNKLNDPPLRGGYVKSQIDWHLRQKRKILPPNYSNDSFYKDLNLFGSSRPPKDKNPLSEVVRNARRAGLVGKK